MNRRWLLGIGCALVALALVPAAPPARAQLLVPAPPPVIVPAPPPVIVPALPVAIEEKIDPALRALMQADPLALRPVIV